MPEVLDKTKEQEEPGENLLIQKLSEVKEGLVRVAVAYTGDFERDGKKFSISLEDLKAMQKQLKTREVPLDYEHWSANPNAPPGHARASGWLKASDGIETLSTGQQVLWAWAEFTPACLAAIRQKEYRYFSPEIHWNAEDEKGKNVGTRLAAGAVTNRPFLKDLPPIEIEAKDYPQLLEAVALSEHQRLMDVGDVHVSSSVSTTKTKLEDQMGKHLKMKKLASGDDKGKHGIFDGEEMVGLADDASLKTCAEEMMSESMAELSTLKTMHASAMAELAELKKLTAKAKAGDLHVIHEEDGDDEGKEEIKTLCEKVGIPYRSGQLNKEARTQKEVTCLKEFAKTDAGEPSLLLAEKMLEENRLTSLGYLRAQKIERLVDGAVKAGKILPKQRQSMYELAIGNYDAVAAYLNEAKKVVDTSVRGIEGRGDESVKAFDELQAQVTQYMTENKTTDYAASLLAVSRKNPELWRRHQTESAVVAGASEGRN